MPIYSNQVWKAGGIPYVVDPNGVFVCLFKSSDPTYGGAAPQLPKGTPDPNETPDETAVREVSEETGIPLPALKDHAHFVSKRKFEGQTMDYYFHCYGFPLPKIIATKRNTEGIGVWLSIDDARRTMRRDQRVFLDDLIKLLQKH